MDRLERVRGADRPVAAGDEAGAGAVQVAEGVLPRGALRAEERDGEVDHLVVVAGPERLDVGRDLQLGEPRHVVGVHQLEVRDVVAVQRARCPRARRAPRGRRGRRGRGRAPGSRPRRGRATMPRSATGSTKERPGVGRRVPAPVEVGLDERRGPVLGDAVLHDLDRRWPRTARGSTPPLLDQLGDLLAARARAPTTAPRRPWPTRSPARGRAQVGRPGVLHAGVGADDGVLPAGDPQRVQVALALEQPGVELVGGRRREHARAPGPSRPRAARRSGRPRRRARRGRRPGRGCRG